MCSITALLGTTDSSSTARQRVLRASHLQSHRGPDWSGIREFPQAIVAHERLAIVDVMSGAQPLEDTETGTVLAVKRRDLQPPIPQGRFESLSRLSFPIGKRLRSDTGPAP